MPWRQSSKKMMPGCQPSTKQAVELGSVPYLMDQSSDPTTRLSSQSLELPTPWNLSDASAAAVAAAAAFAHVFAAFVCSLVACFTSTPTFFPYCVAMCYYVNMCQINRHKTLGIPTAGKKENKICGTPG